MKMRAPPPTNHGSLPPVLADPFGELPVLQKEAGARDAASAPDTEARAIAERYARRDGEAAARRYSLFEPAALQAMQERQRSMMALWRRHGWADLAGREVLEVGCGTGGILLELLRLGTEPAHLMGIELLAERAAVARAVLPPAVRVLLADARHAPIADASQDAVLAFTVFSSILDDAVQAELAGRMWRWVRPGGGVLVYDFCVDNPRNPDVRGVPLRRLQLLFPAAQVTARRCTLAPPLARACAKVHARLPALVNALAPPLRTHRLCWLAKPQDRTEPNLTTTTTASEGLER